MSQWTRSFCFFFFQFHYENTRAQFFVEDASTASALKAVNYKILDRENRRVCVEGLAWLRLGIGVQDTDWDLGFPGVHLALCVFPADIYRYQLLGSTPFYTE